MIEELKNYIIASSANREEKNVMLTMIHAMQEKSEEISAHIATRVAIEELREPNHSA